MGYFLLIAGAILFLTAVQGTTRELGSLLAQDVFSGFIWWFAAILFIGSLGYIKTVRPLSDAFLFLLILVLLVSNRGFFAKINQALDQIKQNAPKNQPVNTSTPFAMQG